MNPLASLKSATKSLNPYAPANPKPRAPIHRPTTRATAIY